MRIVTYHYVREQAPEGKPQLKVLPVKTFHDQVKYLKSTGRIVTTAEVLDKIASSGVMEDSDILLTFDDGYIDHWQNVWPVLVSENVTGLFFISTRAVWERKLTETNQVQLILGSVDSKEIISRLHQVIDEQRIRHDLLAPTEYRRLYAKAGRFDRLDVKYIKNMLQFALPDDFRTTIINQLFTEYVSADEKSVADALYMTVDQVKELREAGMYIGNHGYNHKWFDKLTAVDQRQEIDQSRQQLASIGLANDGWTMCYPYGAYNQETIRLLVETGCAAGFTTKGGETKNRLADMRYEINRLDTNDLMGDKQMQKQTLGARVR
ncbi:MAG: hypothetical protein A3E37_05040 [Candidatus Andersenbacteria bacterium RIFCSPHIGHO2_12_FULL_46_9]|nr:MAG: polysaccharide deacetylase [Parcubacteria group bacterium GW2011_GWA2_45_14]OGY33756.1 MAG: hypothetical protein A3B76_02755 [Candidatus Andersenbacteria bacterium RIFCSPHIGHO2_02_FULL_46_16]OGY36191.1 MAG: hypothetical protein A3I08_05075 [Candidatus Andersenbacteria bacterium RIFCSPLOWO2_02_FULL_46_11]OGY36974.1 MAG: hypothetical protein A3E37_05040 [Candidatus Andersenbacteria bacterium RIFCSPHIGHO2_12_FULL_46_9]OGY39184.1 MAG: hypothetical protein A3G57_02450 [Candidatus Andersenbac